MIYSSYGVRLGVVYNRGESVGTMAVPTFSAVQAGVPVDNTTGIFILSPEVFWNYQRSLLTNPNSIGYRIKNVATIPSVGQIIGSFNLNSPY